MLRFLAFLALFIAEPALASDLDGSWDLASGGTVIFRLTVHGDVATWTHPEHFSMEGDGFADLSGPAVIETTHDVHPVPGGLELTFKMPGPANIPATLRLHGPVSDKAIMSFIGIGIDLEPFELTRTTFKSTLGPWDRAQYYALIRPRPTNARMTAIFDADQGARKPDLIDWKVVAPADAERRKETQALLDAGALQSGFDFLHAALVFQHGDKPEDFLKAHLLAIIAVERGRPDALWIASATLDRYLQNIKQPQVLGTQFAMRNGKADQEPFNRTLISDAMRRALKVPTLAKQVEQGKTFEARDARGRAAAAKPAP